MSIAAILPQVPPSSPDAEMALLGALLMHASALDIVRPTLAAEHFADDRHGRIYDAICAMSDAGLPATVLGLKAWAEQQSELEGLGGWPYIAKLAGSVVTAIGARDYARHILDLWRRRQLMQAAQSLIDEAQAADAARSPAAIADSLVTAVDGIFNGTGDGPLASLTDAVGAAVQAAEAAHKGVRTAVPTGFAALDQLIGGFEPGGLYVIGGRPGMGKTSAGLWIAYNAAAAGHRALFVSLEMADAQLGRRIAAGLAGVNLEAIKTGRLNPADWEMLLRAQRRVDGLPLWIDDRAGLTLAQIAGRARQAARKAPLKLIVVDHLGLIAPPREIARHGLTAAVEHASNGLKRLAKDLGCPVIVLCQLSRAVEGRDDKRPTLADLRQSGAIEQDADAVMFVYREAYYRRRERPAREPGESADAYAARMTGWTAEVDAIARDAEIIVAKQRDGAIGAARLAYDEPTARFEDMGQ